MPFPSARLMGASKAPLSTTHTAMPAALALTAALKALIISPTSALVEPPQVKPTPSREPASAAPYWVGTKNGFVVTWLMNANFHLGCFGKDDAAPVTAPNALSAPTRAGSESAAPPRAIRRSREARSTPPDPSESAWSSLFTTATSFDP